MREIRCEKDIEKILWMEVLYKKVQQVYGKDNEKENKIGLYVINCEMVVMTL